MKSTFNGAVPYRRVTRLDLVGDAIKETTYTMSTNNKRPHRVHRAIRRPAAQNLKPKPFDQP